MKLYLPEVTLAMIDGTCPDLARLSLQDSMAQVDCAEVLVCSPQDLDVAGTRWIKAPDWTDRLGPSAFIWCELPKLVSTGWVLLISWDAWVIDATCWSNQFLTCWSNQFLEYDYVGAPWWYNDGYNVGHGLLRSRRLLQFLADNRDKFPLAHPEDDLLSRHYRPALEQHGFRWAPERIAARFMFECTRPSPFSRHLMFHDSINFPLVLEGERLAERVRLMRENSYLKKGTKIAELESGRRPFILPRLAAAV